MRDSSTGSWSIVGVGLILLFLALVGLVLLIWVDPFELWRSRENVSDPVQLRLVPFVFEGPEGTEYEIDLLIQNNSQSVLEIPYDAAYWPHEHLTIFVDEINGDRVLAFSFATLKSIFGPSKTLALHPGEVFSTRLSVNWLLKEIRVKLSEPKEFQLSGIFITREITVRSNPVRFNLMPALGREE